ncbi:polyprotein [Wheat spindle streak mosaic virus]|uniref:Polyprotein n=5 Tax=Wheat spindle streak mosaic virus TaxID=35285 RepID=A0A385LT56_9POTY|nr:polyprotein [Wheat spindle streak mosaic virus]AYA42712.1 polyprotein [Wheat spindle streak mosaic virus]
MEAQGTASPMNFSANFMAPELFYSSNVKKLKAIFKCRSTTRVIDAIANDFELVAFLILSPAHLMQLETTLRNEINSTVIPLANSDASFETVAVLKTALDGLRYHFGATTLEKGWISMMQHAENCLQESSSTAVAELQVQVKRVGAILISGKNRVESCELFVLHLTARAFRIEYGLKGTCFGEHLALLSSLKSYIFDTVPSEFLWAKTKERSIFTIPQCIKRTPIDCFMLCLRVMPILHRLSNALSLAYWACVAAVNLPSVMAFLFKRQFTKYIAHSFAKHSIYFLVLSILALLWVLRTHFNTQKPKIALQARSANEKEKKLMMLLASAVGITYLFDYDIAEALGNCLHKVSRLSSYLIDDHQGIASRMLSASYGLQAGDATEDAATTIISDLLSVTFKIVDEDAVSGALEDYQDTTFRNWVSVNTLSGKNMSRPLQYPVKQVFPLTPTNVQTQAKEMVESENCWSMVVGHTGSGKSTYLPVKYHEYLALKPERRQNILVCEPTQAATENVCSGIAQNLGRAVYGRHEGWTRMGDFCIQVMTYGSALQCYAKDPNFISTFDAIFLDEAHDVKEHSLVFESICNKFTSVRKFYVSATPRDGTPCPEASRKYPLHVDVSVCDSYKKLIGAQGGGDILDLTRHDTVLVFLSGRPECVKAATLWNASITGDKRAFSLSSDNFATDFSMLTERLKTHKTIIFTTNIIETGVTLSVDCVVDFGFTMRPCLDLNQKTLRLDRRRVTNNERKQRIGRAGRLKAGYAITCGDVDTEVNVVSPDVLYGAALLSFKHNVPFYMNHTFESSWLDSITKAQAETMSIFKLPIFLTRDLVNADGSVAKDFLDVLKKHQFTTSDVKQAPSSTAKHIFPTWPSYFALHQAIHYGDNKDNIPSELMNTRIPFSVSTLSKFDWPALALACEKYRSTVTTVFSGLEEPTRVVTLQTNPANIEGSLQHLINMRESYKVLIENNQNVKRSMVTNVMFKWFSSSSVTAKLDRNIARCLANLSVVDTTISSLKQLLAGNTQLYATPHFQDSLESIVELQAGEMLNEETLARALGIFVPKTNLFLLLATKGLKLVYVVCVLILINLSYQVFQRWQSQVKRKKSSLDSSDELSNTMPVSEGEGILKEVMQMSKEQRNQVKVDMDADVAEHSGGFTFVFPEQAVELEGKGNKYRPREDQRLMYSTRDDATFDSWNEKAKERRHKISSRAEPEMRPTYQKRPYFNFYELQTDSNILEAIFYTTQGDEFFRTANPNKDMHGVADKLKTFLDTQPIVGKHQRQLLEETAQVVIRDNKGEAHRMDISQHDPDKLKNNGAGRVGYDEHRNDFRQEGQAITSPVELEAEFGAQPGGIVLEAATGITISQVGVDVANRVGRIAIGTYNLNCFLYSDWIIAPAHLQDRVGDVVIQFPGQTVCTNTDNLNANGVQRFPGLDLIAIRRPADLKPQKKLVKAHALTEPTLAQMVFIDPLGIRRFSQSDWARKEEGSGRWSHKISTQRGMCGCPVLDVGKNRLIGIHVATNYTTNRNEFQPFTQEVVNFINSSGRRLPLTSWKFVGSACGYLGSNFVKVSDDIQTQGADELAIINNSIVGFGSALKGQLVQPATNAIASRFKELFGNGSFELVGCMNKGLIDKHVITGENDNVHSFMREHPTFSWLQSFMDEYAPSVLSYSAYYKDLCKYNRKKHVLTFNPDELQHATKGLIKMLEDAGLTPCDMRTPQQVISDVQWSTSAGPSYQGKKRDVCAHLNEDEVLNLAEVSRQQFLAGNSIGVWNGSLKAELRTIEKVEAEKTRVFTASPITSLLAMKFYVDDFNKKFYATNLKAPHTVGINKFSRGWEMLHDKLNRPGWLHGSGDGSRFDSSIDPFFFDIIKGIRKHFLPIEHHGAIDLIYNEILNTTICLANGMVIRKNVGNNSGQPSTVVDNTLVLMVSFLYAYIHKTGDTELLKLDERFVFVCNGDDNKFAISPEFNAQFGHDFSPELTELGLTYEFDDITDDICENPYMSLTMVRTPFGIGFSLPVERIVAIMQWARRGGVLHSYLAGISAIYESFNTPKLFKSIYAYLLWLTEEHEADILAAMKDTATALPIPSMLDVYRLHYGGCDIELQAADTQTDAQKEAARVAAADKARADAADAARKQKVEADRVEAARVKKAAADTANLTATKVTATEDGKVTTDSGTKRTSAAAEVTWTLPTMKQANAGLKLRIPIAKLKSVPKSVMQHDNSIALDSELTAWADAVRTSLGITTDEAWQNTLIPFLGWCCNNGASDKHSENQKMQVDAGKATLSEVSLSPFIVHARLHGGLRRIMRAYSDETVLLISEGKLVPRWAMRHGASANAAYAFDFFVPRPWMNPQDIEISKQARLAALGTGTNNTMLTSDTTNLRKTTNHRVLDTDGHPELT